MNIETTRITRLLVAISLASLAGCGGDAATTTTDIEKVNPTEPVSDWRMVWNDEFDSTSIDTNKWNFELNCAGGGNNEKQCYTDSEENAVTTQTLLMAALKCVQSCLRVKVAGQLFG